MLEAHILLVLQRQCECPIYRSKLLWVYNNNILMVGVSLKFCYLIVVVYILVIMSLDFCLIQCLCLHLMLCAYGKLFGKHSQIDVWYVYNVRYSCQAVVPFYCKGMRFHSYIQG